jgi:hypothetical protein
MVAQNWVNVAVGLRGKFIRWLLESPNPNARTVSDAEYDVSGRGMGHYNVDQYPTRDHVIAFKKVLLLNYRDMLDSFGLNFKKEAYITDEMIGEFAGTSRDLTAYGDQAYFTRFGTGGGIATISGSDAQETGEEYEKMRRDLNQKAIIEPDKYVKKANKELDNISEKALDVYKISFSKYYNDYKMTKEESHKRAMADKDVYLSLIHI